MRHLKMITTSLIAMALLASASVTSFSTIYAETLTVAVASNFAETLESIVLGFEAEQSHKVVVVRGSSGNHYAQIIHGAPFDLFFSADSSRP